MPLSSALALRRCHRRQRLYVEYVRATDTTSDPAMGPATQAGFCVIAGCCSPPGAASLPLAVGIEDSETRGIFMDVGKVALVNFDELLTKL